MKDTKAFNPIEAKLINIFESLGGSEVGAFYITSSADCERFDTKAELMEAVTDTLNEWFKERDVVELITDRPTMDCIGDYLPLFLALPNDTTVLAVGNGAVAAPSTTTATLHEDYYHNKFCAIFDYEQTEKAEITAELEQLFPSTLPHWLVTFRYDNSDYNYETIAEAEDRAEAVTKALEMFRRRCDWHYMPWKSIDIKPMEEETAEPETAPNRYYEEPKTECFYTGGGIYCTIHQLSGKMSDYYYGFGSEDGNGFMCLYSHKGDAECNDDEYGFYDVVRYIDIDGNASEAEKAIYWTMAEAEKKELTNGGVYCDRFNRG